MPFAFSGLRTRGARRRLKLCQTSSYRSITYGDFRSTCEAFRIDAIEA